MAGNGNLVPEVRVDRLGRAVTRHVKPVAGPGAARPMPAPPEPARPRRDLPGRVAAIVETLHGTTVDLRSSARVNLFMSGTVDLAERLATSSNFDSDEGRRALRSVLAMGRAEDTGRMLRGFSVIEGRIPAEHLMRTVAGFRRVPALAPYWDQLNAAPRPLQDAARALAAALSHRIAENQQSVKLASVPGCTTKGYLMPRHAVAVADIAIARPDRSGEVAALAAEGATAAQIEAILDGAPRALSDGAL